MFREHRAYMRLVSALEVGDINSSCWFPHVLNIVHDERSPNWDLAGETLDAAC